jgi:Spy/CpxP family protein refolding chaperone
MKNRSRFAILAATLLLGGASVVLVANAADVPATPPSPGASQPGQAGEQQDATEAQSGTEAQDPAGAAGQADQAGHQDVAGGTDQTGDNQD